MRNPLPYNLKQTSRTACSGFRFTKQTLYYFLASVCRIRCHCPAVTAPKSTDSSGFHDLELTNAADSVDFVNRKREKLNTAVLVPEFRAASSALCVWYSLNLGPGFHCSNGLTLSHTKSVRLCVVKPMEGHGATDHHS